MSSRNPLLDASADLSVESPIDRTLRPISLAEYRGQPRVSSQMEIFIKAALGRGEVLDHTLLYGPPGLGKTTLARIIANEMGVDVRATSGPVIERAGDLAAVLTNLEAGQVLFIDEIHRLNPAIEELLYPAMEDCRLDIIVGEGPAARALRLELQPFTLVGATTRVGLLTAPLRARFGIVQRLNFYSREDLAGIIRRSAELLQFLTDAEGAAAIASRSRGTPRIANRLLRRVRDFAQVAGADSVDAAIASDALDQLQVDVLGLDHVDRAYMRVLIANFGGGPVGVETLAAALSEEVDTLEELIEPYLMQMGLLKRTSRGRTATSQGCEHLGLTPGDGSQGLF